MTAQVIALVTAIGALVVPPVVSFLKREKWSAQVKQLIAAVISVAVAVVAIAICARKDFGLPLLQLAALVYAGSQLVFGAYFKGSTADTFLTAIGSVLNATDVPPVTAPVTNVANVAIIPGSPTP